MAGYTTEDIRNVAFVGHGATGKTMLCEGLLYTAGVINRFGLVDEGKSTSDYDPEERERKYSIELSLMHLDSDGKHLNLLDCPGRPDFIASAVAGIAAAETVVLCVSAAEGIQAHTRQLWERAQGKARLFALTKCDNEHARFEAVVRELQEVFGRSCAPYALPVGQGGDFSGVVCLLSPPATLPEGVIGEAASLRAALVESLVSSSDELMEKYLADEPISSAELAGVFLPALLSGDYVPIIPVSGVKALGTRELLELVSKYCPAPSAFQATLTKGEDAQAQRRKLPCDPGGPLYAQVFKNRSTKVGTVSFVKLYSGRLAAKSNANVVDLGKAERFQILLRVQGENGEEVAEALAGDLVAATRIDALRAGFTITSEKDSWRLPPLAFPVPLLGRAVLPKTRKDESRVSEKLRDLAAHDPSFQVIQEPQTKETVIRGMGDQHLQVMLSRLAGMGVEVETRLPKIPYRETITRVSEGGYRHKKQTGGAGQFAECHLRLEPNAREAGFEFLDEIVGGAISKSFVESVRKGCVARMEQGVIAGYPVVDVKVACFDGKEHPVDSKDIAFQIAGRQCFKKVALEAGPVLLEPYVNLEIVVPAACVGDIMSGMSSKRGQVTGQQTLGEMAAIRARVPLAEVQNFSPELNQITAGTGSYTMEPSGYEPVPAHLQQQIIAQAKMAEEEEE